MFTQTSPPQEIIVVDDASPDATVDVVESAGQACPCQWLIRLPTNSGGPALPINVGVAAASGELITVLDQDDVFLPNRIEEHLRAAHGPDLSVAFGCGGIGETPEQIAAGRGNARPAGPSVASSCSSFSVALPQGRRLAPAFGVEILLLFRLPWFHLSEAMRLVGEGRRRYVAENRQRLRLYVLARDLRERGLLS